MILLAERYDLATGWMARVQIEEGATCDRCRGPIGAGETAYVRSLVPPFHPPDEDDDHLELVHPKGKCRP